MMTTFPKIKPIDLGKEFQPFQLFFHCPHILVPETAQTIPPPLIQLGSFHFSLRPIG
jgi:hypothetical protein